MSTTSSKAGLAVMIGAAVFLGVFLAQKAKHQDDVPDVGCSPIATHQQACPLPTPSITLTPSKAAAKKDVIVDDQQADEPEPSPTSERRYVTEPTADPNNPTIAVNQGGGGGGAPQRSTNPMPLPTGTAAP